MARRMNLTVFMTGSSHYHDAGWRKPSSYSDLGYDIDRWIAVARRCEDAKFDALFLADVSSPLEYANQDVFARSSRAERLHPVPLLAALAVMTRHIGLAATVPTSYVEPYELARQMSSIDLISHGRAAWNIVTGATPEDAVQYGIDFAAPAERYARGEEYVDVVAALWDSVAPGAYPRDKASGIYADISKVHAIDFDGDYYKVKGPLSVEPSEQGRPILVQAGQSEPGRALASRVAEVVFTAQSTFESARSFYADIKRRAAEFGRDPNALKILPGIMPIIGRTREEADEKDAELTSLIDPIVGLKKLNWWLHGIDLTKYDLDGPFPELPPTATTSRGTNYVEMARKENLTLRQLIVRAAQSNAHFRIKGSATDIADQMEHWFRNGAADGFNILCSDFPDALDDCIEILIPELRRRGLFRDEYEGRTLRENLGVPLAPIPTRVREEQALSVAGE
jgi:FMN-dependent oxidoreductase (nitrilotriacetate monooxygenase family)